MNTNKSGASPSNHYESQVEKQENFDFGNNQGDVFTQFTAKSRKSIGNETRGFQTRNENLF